ncbi:MAG: copper amine oxidase N-terminal domain-containing protein [Thermacetogeniaceae bacterium]
MVTVVALALALVLTLSVAAVGFADTSGQSNAPSNGRTGQFQNQMNSELIAALASVTGQTAEQIQQQLSAGKTLPQLAQGLDQSTLATAIQQAMTSDIQQRATQMAEALLSGQTAGTGQASGTEQPMQTGGTGQPAPGQGGGQDNLLVQALASATGQTTDQIKQDLSNGQALSQLAQGVGQDALTAAIQQAMASDIQQRATQMAERLISGQMPDQPGANSLDRSQAGSTSGIVLKIGSARMSVKGVAQDIDPGYQTSPVIINGRTFVPVRAIIESLGGKVDWSASDQKITITLSNTPIVLNIGNKSGTVNGVAKTLDDAPFISATGRTMLPLRFITENLGHNVAWDNSTKTITIQ